MPVLTLPLVEIALLAEPKLACFDGRVRDAAHSSFYNYFGTLSLAARDTISPGKMKPAPFDYHAPRKLEEAAELLASLPNAKILAGGQSLVPMMNFRYVIVDHLVDLGGIEDLRGIDVAEGRLRIGAMMRQRDLELSPEIARHCPLMAEALRHVGHRQTRNRGTIGGSLAHADPAAELPAICAAYDAVVHVASVRGLRAVPFREFSAGFMATALSPDEMIAAIDLPLWRANAGHGFHEFARRQGDFALAGAAALLDVDAAGIVKRAALALFGVAEGPLRLAAAEATLTGQALDLTAIRNAAAAARLIEPISDIHASGDYRRHLAQVLTTRALIDAARRAGVDV
jgi:carbon-monoxide dehydrogenase medium subunit